MPESTDDQTAVFTINEDDAGQRLDKFLAAALPDVSRAEVQSVIKAGEVIVNGVNEKASYRVQSGDTIHITLPEDEPQEVLAEDVPLTILYEDTALVAIDKPAGMVVHPAYGNRSGTLVNAALHHWPQMRQVGPREERAGVVHRLDKGTSGVIVMAKTDAALANLQQQFKERSVYKRYIALVEGIPSSSRGIIDAPIDRDPNNRKQMAVVRAGRPAETRFDLVEDLGDHALLSLEPHTGRTHQIRVHLQWLGHPIVGDRIYGYRRQSIKLKRLFLHAAELRVDSPISGERLTFQAPLPAGLADVLAKLRRNLGGSWE